MPIKLAAHSNRTTVTQNIKRRKEKKHKQNTCITEHKLEIWGKAQRESARRPKSDWGKLGGGIKRGRGKFPRHQSHVAQTQMHWHTPNAHCRLRVGQRERL